MSSLSLNHRPRLLDTEYVGTEATIVNFAPLVSENDKDDRPHTRTFGFGIVLVSRTQNHRPQVRVYDMERCSIPYIKCQHHEANHLPPLPEASSPERLITCGVTVLQNPPILPCYHVPVLSSSRCVQPIALYQ